MRFFTSCGNRIKSLNFLELYVEVVGNSFVQCISYRNCCLSRVQYASALFCWPIRPIATDSFEWGPTLIDLEYPDNHRKSQLVSFHFVHG